jgi:hypothetical protein
VNVLFLHPKRKFKLGDYPPSVVSLTHIAALPRAHPSDRSSQLRCPADPAVLHQPHTSFSLYAGQDFVEVLTKCRVHYLLYGDSQLC